MGKIGNFFKNLFSSANGITSFFKGLTADGSTNIRNIIAGASGSQLTDAQKEANQFSHDEAELQRIFNSNEAALQRDWSAAEAERARDWQEEMYAKYDSLSGKIAQAEKAGVNPMIAVTGNAVSPMGASSSAPSGAAASGASASSAVSPSGHSLTDLLGTMMGFMKVKSEIAVNDAKAAKDMADADKVGKESSWLDRLNTATLENILMDTSAMESQLHLNNAQANKLSAETNDILARLSHFTDIKDDLKKREAAEAAIADYNASVARVVSDPTTADAQDYLQFAAQMFGRLIGIGVQCSPKGVLHLN